MESSDSVETDIVKLLAQNYGDDVSKFFYNINTGEILPIFLHNAFLVLKELMGASKAREQLDMILIKHNVVQKYE